MTGTPMQPIKRPSFRCPKSCFRMRACQTERTHCELPRIWTSWRSMSAGLIPFRMERMASERRIVFRTRVSPPGLKSAASRPPSQRNAWCIHGWTRTCSAATLNVRSICRAVVYGTSKLPYPLQLAIEPDSRSPVIFKSSNRSSIARPRSTAIRIACGSCGLIGGSPDGM